MKTLPCVLYINIYFSRLLIKNIHHFHFSSIEKYLTTAPSRSDAWQQNQSVPWNCHEPTPLAVPFARAARRALFRRLIWTRRASPSYRIDHWSLKFKCGNSSGARAPSPRSRLARSRALRSQPSRVSFIAVLLFLVDHAIVSCRLARTRHVLRLFLAFYLQVSVSLSVRRMSSSLPCVDVLGSAPARRSHGSPSADFLTKKQTRALCWRKSTSAGRAEWLNTIWSARRYLFELVIVVSLLETRGQRVFFFIFGFAFLTIGSLVCDNLR